MAWKIHAIWRNLHKWLRLLGSSTLQQTVGGFPRTNPILRNDTLLDTLQTLYHTLSLDKEIAWQDETAEAISESCQYHDRG